MSAERLRSEDLHAYLDRELEPARAGEVEALLAREPEAADAARHFAAQRALLQAAFDHVLAEPVPQYLSRLGQRRSIPRRAAAALSWLAIGCVLGWILGTQQMPLREVPLPRHAALAHAAFSPEVRHAVEVAASDEAHLVGWLSKRLGAAVRAPKLGDLGYELLGGRLLPESDRPGAQFMYQDAAGRRLTLYVSTDVSNLENAFRYHREGSLHVFYWIDRDLGYALAGDLDKQEIARIAWHAHEQLAR
jgi:anti-sigma factor RsiW